MYVICQEQYLLLAAQDTYPHKAKVEKSTYSLYFNVLYIEPNWTTLYKVAYKGINFSCSLTQDYLSPKIRAISAIIAKAGNFFLSVVCMCMYVCITYIKIM